jgi:1-acyl-sn-glycerol-3-phosphate acyltransferase
MIISISRCGLRLLRLGNHFIHGIIKVLAMKRQHGKQWYATKVGRKAIRQWMQTVCGIVGLQITVEGASSEHQGRLYVANHVSWLDIIAIASLTDCKFLSKASVRRWPLIGWLTAAVGSLFIRRHDRTAFHKSLKRLRQRLELGEDVCIFPEGTTSDGRQVLPFYSGLFQAVIEAGATVQPLVLNYQRPDGAFEEHAPYHGRDIFFFHMLRILTRRETHLQMTFLPEVSPQAEELTRQRLALSLEQRIALALDGASIRSAPTKVLLNTASVTLVD